MKFSVIIPCYNAADTIAEQLEALAGQEWSEPWEIVVMDNRSIDESMAIVRQYQKRLPNLRIVDASTRQGQPYALNMGVQAASGQAVAFCDADDVVGPGWVAAMGEALSKHDFVACCVDIKKLNPPWIYKRLRHEQEHGLQNYDYPPYLPHAGGGTIGVKRELHAAVGGFDEALPLLHDTDFCWKLQLAGTELYFVPDAITHVRYRNTFKGIYRQIRGYAEYNVILYKRYRALGMPQLAWQSGMKAWGRLLLGLLWIRDTGDLARWIWGFGWQLGRLQGSIKHRIWAL